MIFGYINSAVAFIFQTTGGATVAVFVAAVVAQVDGGIPLDPALAAAYGAIGALFGLVTWLTKGRIERCEKREDTLLAADSDKTTTLRDLAATVTKAADVAAAAVHASNMTMEETKRNGARIDALASAVVPEVREIRTTATDLARRVDELARRVSTKADQ
jgi:hypothetical protein